MQTSFAAADPAPRSPLLPAPSLRRRMACFVYEGVLLFGVVMAAGYAYAVLTQQRHALEGRVGLQAFVSLTLAVYFVWFWSRTGQTLAMKTWRLRLVTADGLPVSQGRALWRYLLSWLWFAPGLLAGALLGWRGTQALWPVAIGVLGWALLSWLHPQRQFWHDAWAGTRIVASQGGETSQSAS